MKELKKNIEWVVKRLEKHRIFSSKPTICLNKERKRIYVTTEQKHLVIGPYSSELLTEVLSNEDITRCMIEEKTLQSPMKGVKALLNLKMAYNRVLEEFAKKLPFPGIKNKIYRHLRMKIGKDVVVAPNVYFDFLFPDLISIGENTIIGEEAMLSPHYLYPNKIEIGYVKVGKGCCIGGRSILGSGSIVKDNSIVPVNIVLKT